MTIINETLARRAKEMNSYGDYKQGSATAEYEASIAEAKKLAERCKSSIDPMYHDKIDGLLAAYKRRLADAINAWNEIDSRMPSILTAGPSNFSARRKEKQNAARDRSMQEYREVVQILDKMRSVGRGGISADDPRAVEKLKSKLASLEAKQKKMRTHNVEARKSGQETYKSFQLSNNSAEIRRLKKRIEELEHKPAFEGWTFEGGSVVVDEAENRLKIVHDEKPAADVIEALKTNGFHWSPKNKAWQRQLTENAMRSARRVTKKEEG